MHPASADSIPVGTSVFKLKPLAAAAALAAIACAAEAQITSSGAINTWPGNLTVGPGNTDLGNNGLSVGNAAPGWLDVAGGALLRAGGLFAGPGGNGNGQVTIQGLGTRVELAGDGTSSGALNRFGVGEWGYGSVTVSDGATLDGRANASACLGVDHYCNNFIGNAAGSTGVFTVTGAGSNASFLRYFGVGGLAVFHPPIDSFTFGTPGGTTQGTVKVLAGGSLTTDGAQIGLAPGGGSPLGTERSFGDVTIDGTGSVWKVTGGTLESGGASFTTATHKNAWATLSLTNGGKLQVDGVTGYNNVLLLTTGGGRTDMLVAGAGSAVEFNGDAASLQVGRRLGSANLILRDGGQVNGVWYVTVGRDGSFGELTLEGVGTRLSAKGTASVAAAGSLQNAVMDIGRNGTGVVHVRNGARIDIDAVEARVNGPHLNLGREAASSGTLNIDGAGSVVSLSAASVVAGGGPGEAFNPLVKIGRDGSGQLNITNGGKLLMDGQAVSTVADPRSTTLMIGGTSDVLNGGRGIALVSGAGSEIALSGSDPYIGVGHGPQTNGQLTVQSQGVVSATNMNVGRSGGVGLLKLDAATLNLSGQQTGNNLSGAALSIGVGGGIGVATIGNGSQLNISNMGSAGASLNLGGSGVYPLGDGSLTLSGGSAINITAAPGLAAMSVGRDGTAFARVRGGSSIDLGDGSLYIGRLSGSDGTLIVSENSVIDAGWVGVGRRKLTGGGDADGGTATMVINNSTLNAPTIIIGTNGFLGGNGTINGTVTNYGIFSPGNSPGTMTINGAYSAAAGSRLIMEVESDGAGGFKTDQVVFGEGSLLDLSALKVEFRFLGDTNPNAFQSSGGFDVDMFFRSRGAGGDSDLAHDLFATASFTAQADQYMISDFTFSADGGATFTAVQNPVPEPGTWALMLGGLLLTASAARRRRR